jgi:hypothetical protein
MGEREESPDAARRLFGSLPNVNELAPPVRAEVLDAVAGLVEQAGGLVHDPHVTVLYLSRPA